MNKETIEQWAEAAVYCGTYEKYNNGSIAGEWIKFSDYSDAEEFFKALKDLHDDETDPEFMFQDSEYLPDSLYSESLSPSDVEAIYDYLEVAEKIADYSDSDWMQKHNEYCSENNIDDEIYDFDEDFFNTFFEDDPMAAARATAFGDVYWSHNYIKFDGYANLQSFSDPSDEIDYSAIIEWLIENPQHID